MRNFLACFLYLTKGIKPAVGGGCDNDLMIRAAAGSNEWKWPSDMHTKTYTGIATSQKNLTILLLVLFQKLFRDKQNEFPIVALWSFAHVTSIFLIYLIASNYWGANIALLVSLLYFSSFWMWQMSLFVGHLNVATMFFLLSVYVLTFIPGSSPALGYFLLFVSGAFFCCTLFASSSSLRYALLFFATVFFAKHQAVGYGIGLGSFRQTITDNGSLLPSVILILIFIFLIFLLKISYKKVIAAIYNRRAWLLNGLISAKKYPLEHYLKKAKEQLPNFIKWSVKPVLTLFIVVNLIGFNYFLLIAWGFGLVVLALTLPDIKKSLTFYFNYLYISYIKPGINSGLVRYVRYGYFAKNKIPIPPNLRGGGFWWVPKIYARMAPFHTLIYSVSLIAVISANYFSVPPLLDSGALILLIIASLLPILWAELTKAYQVARSYSSGLLGFMILIGFAAFIFQSYYYFWPIAIGLLVLTFTWNGYKFFGVIYPARMSFNKIVAALDKYDIKEIYTYDTFYNESFFDNVKTTPSLNNLKINFIKSLTEVKNGWILIPPTTHKAGYIAQEESIRQGDFTEDPALNKLLETKEIERIAISNFPTVYGSDNIWFQEADVMSYFDLMLHYITKKDRFRGYAWLLHSDSLKTQI